MHKLLIACSVLALTGCGTVLPAIPGTTPAPAANPVTTLQSFTITDLQNALTDAQATGDVTAANCYTALIPAVQNVASGATSPVTGAFSAFQKARDIAEKVNAGVPTGLNIACAPLVLSSQATVVQLGALIGGSVVTGGTLLPLLPLK